MLTRRHLLCCGAAAGLFTSLAGPARAGLLNGCRSGIPDDLKPLLARTFDGLDAIQLWTCAPICSAPATRARAARSMPS